MVGVLLGCAPFLRVRPGVTAGVGNGGPKRGRSPGFPLEEQQQHGEKGKGEKKFSKTNMGRSRAGGGTGAQEQLGAVTLRRTPLILELRDGGTERAVSAAGGGRGQAGGAPLLRCWATPDRRTALSGAVW